MRSITSVIGRMARRRFKISVRVRFCKRDKRGVWSAWLSLVSEGVVRGGWLSWPHHASVCCPNRL
jgi:hypothetical protein